MSVLQPRSQRLAALEERVFDVLVIGGGITGAAVARDAAARELSVALVDKGDWASGTSWRSSKLVHGGLRYLKTGNVRLVFESLSERARLSRLAPHLVRPTDFLFPAYRDRGVPAWKLEVGLTLYDLLSLGREARRHRRLSREETLLTERMLASPDLVGAGLYGDGRTDDARLTLENVLDAGSLGAVPVSGVAVEGLKKDAKGRVTGARARDVDSGRDLAIRARVVVNATGPWGDTVRMWDDAGARALLRLSRGAHLTVPAARLPLKEAVAFPMDDGRLLFAVPYDSVTLLGTTDTDHQGAIENVRAAREDAAYILAAAGRTFPAAALGDADVVSTFASLRPLVAQPGVSVGETSREEAIDVAPSGLVTVTGGKLTTHVRMGRKAVDAVAKQLAASGVRSGRSRTFDRPFPGAPDEPMPQLVALLMGAREPGLSGDTLSHLANRYGRRAWEVMRLTVEDRSLARPIVEGLPDIDGEIVFAARFEDARSLSDVLARRTHLFWQAPGQGGQALERAAELLGRELGWTPVQRRESCDAYLRDVARSREWKEKT